MMFEGGQIDLAVILILLPLLGAAAAFVAQRRGASIGLGVTAATALASLLLVQRSMAGDAYHQFIGGWTAPLGIALAADGLTVLMLAMTGVVGLGVALQAWASAPQRGPADKGSVDAGWAFWPLHLLLIAGLNALYLSADQFNLYVTLEIVSLAAVGLTALSGKPEALTAAMRYLFVGLLASLLYLLGVALLYAQDGVLDIASSQSLMQAQPAAQIAMVLMISGLAAKTALFPLHFWLPGAHGSAIPPVSGLLSALVVKASFYLIVRLWFDLFTPGGITTQAASQLLGVLGAGAVLWGSVQAILAERLKLLVAYSTIAQIGYLFLLFPLDGAIRGTAFQGAIYLALAHGFAKAALFLVCQRVHDHLGHDRIDRLVSSPALPRTTQITIGLAAVSLIGLPPSGGFVGKWLLMTASLADGFSAWSAIVLAGTLLSAAAMFRILLRLFAAQPEALPRIERGGGIAARLYSLDLVPLMLAVLAILLGFGATPLLALLAIPGLPS